MFKFEQLIQAYIMTASINKCLQFSENCQPQIAGVSYFFDPVKINYYFVHVKWQIHDVLKLNTAYRLGVGNFSL